MDLGRAIETKLHNERRAAERKTSGQLALEARPRLKAERQAKADARGRQTR